MIRSMKIAAVGLQASARKFDTTATEVVTAGVATKRVDTVAPRRDTDPPNAFFDMMRAEQGYKANLAVLVTAQEMSSALLDDED